MITCMVPICSYNSQTQPIKDCKGFDVFLICKRFYILEVLRQIFYYKTI